MLVSEPYTMQSGLIHPGSPSTTLVHDQLQQTAMSEPYQDNNTNSTISSPRSQKASIVSNLSQASQFSLPQLSEGEATPPSSVASSQDQVDIHLGSDETATPKVGKKRTASGDIKEASDIPREPYVAEDTRRLRARSCAGTESLAELSQSLKTTLSYAMVKVQNGWQNRCLDEVESLASQSPRSVMSPFHRSRRHSQLSPRSAMAARRETTNLNRIFSDIESAAPQHQPEVFSRGLAAPAQIDTGNRRRLAPNRHLQVTTSPQQSRPRVQQRTPSQNAAMEADAVETLLFMSASPNNSGCFPSGFSPVTQVFSSQTSPTRMDYSLSSQASPLKVQDRSVVIGRLLENLDEDDDAELDKAIDIVEQRRAARLTI